MTRRRERLTAADIQGAWAIIPTPAKENASDWRARDTVDLDETARVVEAMISSGIDGLLTLGTLGECASLDWDEKRAFMAVLADVTRGRIPVFAGTTSLGTRETIRQTLVARDLGLDGTMVGPGMWNKPDVGTVVQFYTQLAEAVSDIAICVYANPFVFKFDYPPPFWAEVARIPQVVCAKVAGFGTLLRDLAASDGRIRFMPIESEYYGAARLAPDAATAFWSSGASCGPAPVVRLRDLIARAKVSGDWEAAKVLSEELAAANLPILCYGDLNAFQAHNVTLEKGRMEAANWLRPGPNRPPYHVAPQTIQEYARTGGRLWAALHRKYS